jgi:trigger factor
MPAATFNPEAQRRVKLGLLVNQISSDHKFNASKEQIDAHWYLI